VLTDPARPLRDLERRVDDAVRRLRHAATATLRRAAHRVDLAGAGLRGASPFARLATDRHRLEAVDVKLRTEMARSLVGAQHRVGALAGRLDSLSPLAVLGRGYSLTRTADGDIVRDATQVVPGDAVDVLLARGRLECRVEAAKERDDRPQV
jgi:exodeoxyribonuclease VII large subunit